MVNLLKWVYSLGVEHERRRIKLLVADHITYRPNPDAYEGGIKNVLYRANLERWSDINKEFIKLIEPVEAYRDRDATYMPLIDIEDRGNY